MRIAIDIDGTICEEKGTFERAMAKPIPEALNVIKRLKKAGHTIIFFTARGWPEYNITVDWLERHDFPFDQLICGKINYDVFIEDRSELPEWDKIKEKYL